MTRFLLIPILVSCAVLPGAGCRTLEEAPVVTPEARVASLVPFENVKVGNESLSDYVWQRTAFLFSGVDLPETTQANETSFTGKGTSKGDIGYGSAAAVDRRGYFVTAAHCVDDSPETLRLAFSNAGTLTIRKARVVFSGEAKNEGSDFALVYAPVRLEKIFEWGGDPAAGAPVMFSGMVRNTAEAEEKSMGSFEMAMGGGIVKSVNAVADSPYRFQLVRHSAPVYHGNSGGPLVGTDGRLIGINISGTFSRGLMRPLEMQYSSALRPDVRWLQEIIERDAATLSGG